MNRKTQKRWRTLFLLVFVSHKIVSECGKNDMSIITQTHALSDHNLKDVYSPPPIYSFIVLNGLCKTQFTYEIVFTWQFLCARLTCSVCVTFHVYRWKWFILRNTAISWLCQRIKPEKLHKICRFHLNEGNNSLSLVMNGGNNFLSTIFQQIIQHLID